MEELFAVLSREGQLPAGVAGKVVFEELRPAVQEVAHAVEQLQQGQRLPPHPIDVEIAGVRITGWAPPAWPAGFVLRQYSRVRARHELGAWIRHLLAQASGASAPLWLVGRRSQGQQRQVTGFSPVDEPLEPLSRLVSVWLRGQERLVAFEPECARALWGYEQRGRVSPFQRDQVARRFRDRCQEDPVWKLAFRGQSELFEIDADDPAWSFPAVVRAITAPLEAARQPWDGP
jgi:exonuclease V gamma subunit